ncbi:MAG: PaaI family thioesterase [Dialister sp.]|nr:PaaI family thioesterase [Dialister sp.]
MGREIGMLTTKENIEKRIRRIYEPNHFMADYFHIHIDEIGCGRATVSLKTSRAKHTNHRGVIHGGVLAALADSVTGVTSATVGAVVVTVSMTMNFIRNTAAGNKISVTSQIIHNGHTTIVISATMTDEEGKRMAEILATMMVVDRIPDIPRKW